VSMINWSQVVGFSTTVVVTRVISIMLLPLVLGWFAGAWAMGPGIMGDRHMAAGAAEVGQIVE